MAAEWLTVMVVAAGFAVALTAALFLLAYGAALVLVGAWTVSASLVRRIRGGGDAPPFA